MDVPKNIDEMQKAFGLILPTYRSIPNGTEPLFEFLRINNYAFRMWNLREFISKAVIKEINKEIEDLLNVR